MSKLLLAGASALAIATAGQAAAADRSAPWQAQIGDTATVQTMSKGGAGITIAIVDTGVLASNPEIYGRVSSLSSCAAVTFSCANGYTDDNSHGTAVAAIAGGKYSATAPISMSGVAPAATIIAEKVLSASGTGYSTDVANGIIKAADAGAKVINLSLTYSSSSTVVKAINYATAKGAVIVWAGGNSATNFNGGANTTGLTTASLQRMIFVGSVSSTNVISSFSNKPGTASAYAGSTSAKYSSLWLVAPGQGIIAPYATNGNNSFSAWTGTSMSAPEVAGGVALLEAAWPILYTKGTASIVLFVTTTDLGSKGVDSTYGNGLLNLDRAFKPIGTLNVVAADGSLIPVSSLTSSMLSSGALGDLSTVSGTLSSYTAFDYYTRNFTVDLSGLISSTGASTSGSTSTITSSTTTSSTGFVGGGRMLIMQSKPLSFAQTMFGERGANDIADRMFGARDRAVTYVSLVDGAGNVVAMGRGISSTASFAEAMWGADTLAADQSGRFGTATALMSLAQGGYSAAAGYNFGDRARLAVGWSSTDLQAGSGQVTDRTRSTAKAAMVGVNFRLTHRLTAGAAVGTLAEENGMLGATYDGAGPLTLGAHHRSRSVSFASSYDLGGGRSLMADATVADTDGASMASSLIRDVSALKARAYGVSFIQADAFKGGDRLTLSVRKPLRVISGQASIAVTTVDQDGYPVTSFTPVDLAPSGDETDVSVAYAAPFGSAVRLSGAVEVRSDARNTDGLTDVGARLGLNLAF
jgi:hypothetical protein